MQSKRRTFLSRTAKVLTGIALLGSVVVPAAAEEIVLKAISPWSRAYYWTEGVFKFQEMVNERLAGKVRVDYLGSKEIIPSFEQFEGLRNGVVDVILGASSYYTGQVPEAMSMLYARVPPTELRSNGFYDYMREVHLEKGNVIFLANVGGGVDKAFRMYVNKPIDKPDFSGMKFRVSPVYVELVKALGGTPVVMKPGEIYTALERGVVDGYGWSYGGIADFGWQEITKYAVDHGFYSANLAILVNADKWNELPQDVRDELEQIGIDLEIWATQYMDEQNSRDNELLKKAGVQFVTFSEEDRKKYLSTAYDAAWAEFEKKHPDITPKLKQLTGN